MIKRLIGHYFVILGVSFWATTACGQTLDEPSVAVKLAPIQEKNISETLFSYGVLDPDPNQIMHISLTRPVLINRIWVRQGQRIKRGEKLGEVETLPEAHMQFLQAQTTVDFAQRDVERKKRMSADHLMTKAEVDAALMVLRDAKLTLKALRERGFNKLKEIIHAPTDGIITQLDVAQGQRVATDSNLMILATERRLIARLGIEPEDLEKIKRGTPVTITPVFMPNQKINSHITDIHAMINPSTHLVEILAPIPEENVERLILGSKIIGHIRLSQRMALVVPRTAVLETGNAKSYLFRAEQGKAKYIAVETGVEVGDFIEVSGDLSKGDQIVILGNYQLQDGMMIREAP